MFYKKFINYKKTFLAKNLGLLLNISIIFLTLFIGVFIGEKIENAKYQQVEVKRLVNKNITPRFTTTKDIDFALFWDIWDKIKKDYVNEGILDEDLFYGALSGLVKGLDDPYSVFLKPQVAEEFQSELSGKFEGIGAEIGIRDDILTIISPLSESPAERAGIRAGDKVLAINDYNTKGISLDYAVKLIRGDRGTTVSLLVSRDGLVDAKKIDIVRDKIVIKSVQWNIKDDIANVRILQFGTETIKEFDKAVREVVLKNPKGIILDLRNDPGGFLDAAIAIAGEWIPEDVIVYESFKGIDSAFSANGKGRLSNFKTVVLINGGSASASEIVAGALKDYNLATVVGEKSFGKGSVQDYTEYKDGSALKLTISLWLTPNKNSINGEGIHPNVEVELTENDFIAGKDTQLEKAIELLK